MAIYEKKSQNIRIKAKNIEIGSNVSFGKNIDIDVRGLFHIGNRSHLGNNVTIKGNNVVFGDDLYHSAGLVIGGGGYTNPDADFTIGDRCTIHNNYINLAKQVVIGNDVGLSLDVSIITHGYWLSVLDGYPAKFAGVRINNGVIVGYRSAILMGVSILKNIVVGAGSVVTKNLTKRNSIYAGNPARFIREIAPLSEAEKKEMVDHIISEYKEVAKYHGIESFVDVFYPVIKVNNCHFDINGGFVGKEDEVTDHFRDYVRKWGLRYYSNRPFKTIIKNV